MNAQKYTQKSLEAVQNAQSIATEYGNQQIEQPHLLLALLDTANRELKELFRTYNVQKEGVLQALTNVRGNQRVTSDNPEETYNALKKYGSDWWSGPGPTSWTRSSAGTTKSATSSVS